MYIGYWTLNKYYYYYYNTTAGVRVYQVCYSGSEQPTKGKTDNPHHEAEETRVKRDAEMVNHVITAIDINPFRITSEHLNNIHTGQSEH